MCEHWLKHTDIEFISFPHFSLISHLTNDIYCHGGFSMFIKKIKSIRT